MRSEKGVYEISVRSTGMNIDDRQTTDQPDI